MVVAVAVVLVMQMPVDEIVDVVAVRDRLVAAVRPVDVVGGVAGARVAGAAGVRVALVDAEDVIVHVVAVRVAQMPVLDEVDVPLVDDGDVAAAGAVDVLGGCRRCGVICPLKVLLEADGMSHAKAAVRAACRLPAGAGEPLARGVEAQPRDDTCRRARRCRRS